MSAYRVSFAVDGAEEAAANGEDNEPVSSQLSLLSSVHWIISMISG